MSLKAFYSELEKGLKAPVYLLYSEDPYLLREAAFSAKRAIAEGETDFLFHMFDMDSPGSRASVEQIIDVLYTVPLMGGRKTVVVDNLKKISDVDVDKLADYASSPSPESVLILLNSGALKKHARERLGKTKRIPLDIRERDLPFWIMQKATAKGLRMTDRAVEYLIGAIGPDAGLLSSEVEKFTLCGKAEIDAEDVGNTGAL
jgi:DNA polymerase III delta subunit